MAGLFLVLEPGNHMYLVIEAAYRQGLTVVVCHSQPVAPPAPFDRALACVSHFLKVDGWRVEEGAFEAIVAWCGDRPVRGTYAGFEVTLRMEVRLRSHFGLPGCDSEKIDFLLNKLRVRDALRRASLSSLRMLDDAALRQLEEWPFPGRAAFLKPVNGSGSTYVRRCTSIDDVRQHLAEWDGDVRRIRRFVVDHLRGQGHGLFLEEEAVGELVSLEGYCHGGRYVPIGVTDRTVLARDVSIEMGNTFPCPHPRYDEIVAKVSEIHKCLGITHGPTHTELIVPEEGAIELVEVNLRFAGGDILILVNRAFGVQFEDVLVRLSLGEEPGIELPATPRCYASGQDFLAPAGVRAVEAVEIPGEDVFFKKVTVKLGEELKSTAFQADHVAAFVLSASSYRRALARASEVRAAATINGRLFGNDPNNIVINYAERWLSAR